VRQTIPVASDRLRHGDTTGTIDFDRITADPDETPLRRFQRQDLKDAITRCLSQVERLIIIMYYYEQMSMKEIGKVLDLSESRVSQMHKGALIRIRPNVIRKLPEMEEVA